MVTVACVLRSGGPYNHRHVEILRKAVDQWLTIPHEFVCLDDQALKHDWPGWWSKIELFTPGLFSGRVLYLDLDNVVCGPLNALASTRGRVMLRDFFLGSPSTAAMAWDAGDFDDVYLRFAADPEDAMNERHKVTARQKVYGDQSWVERCLVDAGQQVQYWQDILPGCVVKWNDDPRASGRPSVACFMGRHKPWNSTGWAAQAWNRYAR